VFTVQTLNVYGLNYIKNINAREAGTNNIAPNPVVSYDGRICHRLCVYLWKQWSVLRGVLMCLFCLVL